MAGSYEHVTKKGGIFRGLDLIDNLGDAHEALEECVWMIKWLAGGDEDKLNEAHRQFCIDSYGSFENAPWQRLWYDKEETND